MNASLHWSFSSLSFFLFKKKAEKWLTINVTSHKICDECNIQQKQGVCAEKNWQWLKRLKAQSCFSTFNTWFRVCEQCWVELSSITRISLMFPANYTFSARIYSVFPVLREYYQRKRQNCAILSERKRSKIQIFNENEWRRKVIVGLYNVIKKSYFSIQLKSFEFLN